MHHSFQHTILQFLIRSPQHHTAQILELETREEDVPTKTGKHGDWQAVLLGGVDNLSAERFCISFPPIDWVRGEDFKVDARLEIFEVLLLAE